VPPAIALVVYLLIPLFLIRHDSKTDPKPSKALWIPVIWMFIMASRLPSQWIGRTDASAAAAVMDGSPLDRGIFLVLMALAIGALAVARLRWWELVARNSALAFFLLFALLSVIWSDYPFVTFKRWFRDMGMYLMILVVLAHPRPLDHISTFIRRLSYFLVFLSIMLVKYYSAIGVAYDFYSGAPEYVGATTSKNMLGAVCLISGIYFFWDTLRRWPERQCDGFRTTLIINVAMIALTLWLLMLSNSATSKGCLVIGWMVVALLNGKWVQAFPRAGKALIPVTLSLYVVLELVLDLSTSIAGFLGRDPTLHGRTGIWAATLAVENNPLVGVGYQSFWLGDRLAEIWRSLGAVNEAHNGFLEVYLSLGGIGVALLGLILVGSYLRLVKELAVSQPFASLGLSMWSIMIVYNLTEAAFPASFLWSVFLICGIAAPLSTVEVPSPRVQTATASKVSHITVGGGIRTRPLVGLAGLRVHRTFKRSRSSRRPSARTTSRTSSK
jgi:exopolysaccharide production protein ExoQ